MIAIVVTIVWGVLTVPGVFAALFSVMFFDAPGSIDNPAAWLNALVVVSFPCLCVIAIVGTWILHAVRRSSDNPRLSIPQIGVACLPLLPVAYVALMMLIGTVGVVLSGQPLGLHSTVITPAPSGQTSTPHR